MIAPQAGTLVLEEVSKTFPQRDGGGEVRAVDRVSLSIGVGEFVTLLGPSGCGKTTTLRLISGFEFPSSGRILLDGKDISNRPPNKRDMAMVFQSYALFPHMTVANNVAYGLRVRHVGQQELKQRVAHVLDLMGLAGLAERRPHEMSGGQQQRVALARSLVVEPRVLLFDEPLSNLDAKLRVQMRSEIRNIQRRLNITSVYVTHDQVEAMALSDRIVVMNDGHIEQMGTPEEIYRRPVSRFVADFIGRANFVEGTIHDVSGERATVSLLGQTVTVSAGFQPHPGDTVTVVLRPESLVLRSDPGLEQVRVEQMMYLGSSVEYLLARGDQRLIAVDTDPRSDRLFREGDLAGLTFEPETVHILPARA
ncbi:MAG TPA: ABC transporter ATP-binding protein [Aggregatilinea sp.]|uniref:ABC transporter ATP-binding protein n=1 Tax=Aggregatilinea sp. TaxID=2806333 RepID=UPI002C3FB272|nr:ABC transporter ATP-binding protein [Aggregatilinea sp.]HML20217.1 ABC transporter ATP-binding protein [Aggregatilinea sp.]